MITSTFSYVDTLNCTLLVRHLPACLTDSDKMSLLSQFGACRVRVMSSDGPLKHCAFASFRSVQEARVALLQLHQLNVVGSRLVVTWARAEDRHCIPTVWDSAGSSCASEELRGSLEQQLARCMVEQKCPTVSQLAYRYPRPNRLALRIASDEQACLPCPFDDDDDQWIVADMEDDLPETELTGRCWVAEKQSIGSADRDHLKKQIRAIRSGILPAKLAPRTVGVVPRSAATKRPALQFPTVHLRPLPADGGPTLLHCSGGFGTFGPAPLPKEKADIGGGEFSGAIKAAEPSLPLISVEEIQRNRVDQEQMKLLPAFKNYSPGERCSRLYVKNLSKRVTDAEMRRIFGNFVQNAESEHQFHVKVIQTGRLHGQAFLAFGSVEEAEAALQSCNGYILHGKPMVVAFSRQFIVRVLYAEINNSSFSKMSAVNKNNLHQPGTSNGRSVNSTSRNEVRYDMPFKPMYSNTLPDVPFEAKFLPHPFPADRHVKYETTMMERAYTGELVTEDDVGIFIDLVLIDKYEPNPNEPVQLHPTDELLCSDEDTLLSTMKKSRHGTKAVPWMRRTEYISTDYSRFGVQTERQETKLGYHIQKVLKEASLYRDRESQLTAINKTFEDAKKPVREHFSKRDVYAVEELPLLPDFDAWKYPFAQVIFDVDPAPRDKTSLEETLATDQICRAMIRGMMDEKGEQFVAYFVPTLETIRKLKSVEGKDISEMDLSTPFDFKLLREYNWSVKNKASVGYEENHFFSFRDGRAYYNELETRVRLNRRRVKDGHVHSAVPNSRLIVRYRDFNDQELAALSARSMIVNPIEEEDDDDDEEAEAEKHVDDTAGEKKLDTDQSNQPPAKDNNNQWSDNEVKSDEGSPVVEEETEEEIEVEAD
ncbi:RNA polymerase II-associated factor [Trichinella spiralis]|uniref:RNA polymerase II-associated factor 1 homolog n=1 Tax=Trichinella spiralis TaxID=6334 RepID=A0ABR3L3N4_TRISP